MFAMTSLVGTPVVAAPKATRAVRSTKTVAAAKKAPAKKAPAKKVRTLTNFQRTYLDPLPSTAARSRTGGPERARRAHRRPVTFVEARIGRRSHRRAGNREPYPRFLSQLAEKHDCRPTRFARCFAFREDENDTPTDRRVSPLFRPRAQGEKKSFGEWLLNAACRDSGAIGAGYEGELKDGRFKGKKK